MRGCRTIEPKFHEPPLQPDWTAFVKPREHKESGPEFCEASSYCGLRPIADFVYLPTYLARPRRPPIRRRRPAESRKPKAEKPKSRKAEKRPTDMSSTVPSPKMRRF